VGRISPVIVVTAGILACMLVPSVVFIAVSAFLDDNALLGRRRSLRQARS